MSEYLTPPSDCITTYEDVLESPVQCTTLLTLLTIFSTFSSTGCNETSLGQVHYCTAREINEIIEEQDCWRFFGVIIKNLYLPLPLSATPIGVSANKAYRNGILKWSR